MALSSLNASGGGGWLRCAACTVAPATHAQWLAVSSARHVAAGASRPMVSVTDRRAVQGASRSAQLASSPSRAAVTGREVMTGAQYERPSWAPGRTVGEMGLQQVPPCCQEVGGG